jgi:UDP-N-acetylglucosamine 2-epimerase (non-hydrolysing)
MDRIADALLQILEREDVVIVLPMHLNPNVRNVLGSRLAGHPRAEIIAPLEYADFVGLLSLAHIVLTDSGGVQEEAPSLGKPVLVLRDTTERPEGVQAGTARLVGTERDRIVAETFLLLDKPEHYWAMSRAHNPFGDGHASERIVKVMLDAWRIRPVRVVEPQVNRRSPQPVDSWTAGKQRAGGPSVHPPPTARQAQQQQ